MDEPPLRVEAGLEEQTLPFGSPSDVRREVAECCRALSPDGGFGFNAIHNVQAKTPIENVVAMIESVKAFSGAG